jgi:hypothetical protein
VEAGEKEGDGVGLGPALRVDLQARRHISLVTER